MPVSNDDFIKQYFSYQLSIFPTTWEILEKKYPNINFQANKLYQEKFLSFNPAIIKDLDENQCTELLFLIILFFHSGLSKEYVAAMLNSNLKKPYCYYLKSLSWDFENGKWILLSDILDEKYEDFLKYKFSFDLDTIIESMDKMELASLQEKIAEELEKKSTQV
jgi:hypothetical protein